MSGFYLLFSTFYILIACINEFYVCNDFIMSLSTESRHYFFKLYIIFSFSSCRTITSRFSSVPFSSVAQSCPTLCDPMNCSTPGLPVHRKLLEFTQTHAHRVGDSIQPSHPLSSPSPPAPNPSQHQGLFQRVSSSHEVAKELEFQLQHQSFQ